MFYSLRRRLNLKVESNLFSGSSHASFGALNLKKEKNWPKRIIQEIQTDEKLNEIVNTLDKKKIDINAYYINSVDHKDTIVLKESINDRPICYVNPYVFEYHTFNKSHLMLTLPLEEIEVHQLKNKSNILKHVKNFIKTILKK